MKQNVETAVLGNWYEDFDINQEFRSPGRTITESDLSSFAAQTGDYSQVHTDEEFCRKTEFGARIAHGLLGLSITQGLMSRTNYTHGTGVASLSWDKWKFLKPIMIGDTIHVRWKIAAKRESKSKPDMGILTECVELRNQRNEVVQQGEHITMVRKRNN